MSLSQLLPYSQTLLLCDVVSQTRGCPAAQGSSRSLLLLVALKGRGHRTLGGAGWNDLWIFWSSELEPVFRIRISFHADPDLDPGSQKCPYGSGSKEENTKEE